MPEGLCEPSRPESLLRPLDGRIDTVQRLDAAVSRAAFAIAQHLALRKARRAIRIGGIDQVDHAKDLLLLACRSGVRSAPDQLASISVRTQATRGSASPPVSKR